MRDPVEVAGMSVLVTERGLVLTEDGRLVGAVPWTKVRHLAEASQAGKVAVVHTRTRVAPLDKSW